MIADTYGWLLVEQGQVGQGIEILRKAAAAPAATPEIRYHLAAALARDGQRDSARDMLQKISTDRGNGYETIRPDVERLLAELGR
jgi:Flp pilus assembly protein TadD